jgi:predicted ArsR family transcriptional regulator
MTTPTTSTLTQQDKLIDLFETGKDLTIKQIARKLRVSESRARFLVTELRQEGYAVYRNRSQNGRNFVFRLGQPSREMVAFAAQAGGAFLFQ